MPAILVTAHEERQDRLLARADRTADQAEAAVRGVWFELLKVIKAGGHFQSIRRGALAAIRRLPAALHVVTEDLGHVARDSARWTAEALARTLPKAHRERLLFQYENIPIPIPVLEAERGDAADFLVGSILPALTNDQVNAVLYAHGWLDRVRRLTKLADPEVLAGRIAALTLDGKTTQEIAREIRPVLQGVQTSARRVARTAGLWIAHEAELTTYDQLGDMIEGYQIHAVLDHATRPEHRKRDGRKYYKEPKGNQRSVADMPHPPREADGSWAFNCRCWLSPILAGI